jgi:Na+/pantothenate symporter
MMVNLSDALILLLIVALIILVIIFTILGIKLIRTLKKVDEVIEDVNLKMNKVNGVFDIIDKTTDYASTISDKIIGTLSKFINTLFFKKKGSDDDE